MLFIYNINNNKWTCMYVYGRYKIYIEGWAWSVSEKYILACDSPTLYFTPRWYDFFIRGMIPQKHYWPVRDNDKCRSLKYAVEYAKIHPDKVLSSILLFFFFSCFLILVPYQIVDYKCS